MDENQRISLFKDEYLYIQSVIHDFDGRALTIKAWSVSFSLAAIGGAFAADAPAVLLVASLSSILFWIVETLWKTTQNAFYARSQELEGFFAGEQQEIMPLQVGTSWYAHYQTGRTRTFFRILLWLRVALPHAAVAAIGFVLFVLSQIGTLKV